MTQFLYVLMAMAVGVGSAVQVGLVGSLGRERGPTEAAWINVLGTIGVISLLFGVQTLRNDPPSLPSPFNTVATFGAVAAVMAFGLWVSMKGLDPYLAIAGFFGVTYLFGAGYLAPKIGIALFVSAVTAGNLTTSIGLDHFGAFGGSVFRITPIRILGVMALFAGVMLVRSGR